MTNCNSIDSIRLKYARKYLQYSTKVGKNYYTRNEEYLKARNKTHKQNQFTYLISGKKDVNAGAPNTVNNMYRNTVNKITCDNVENAPNNYKYAKQGSISSGLRLMDLKRNLYKR